MIKFFLQSICVIFLLTGSLSKVFSQNQPITKSEILQTIDNKQYYIHTVQAKETAYAISRAYGISYTQLTEINPGIENGLSIGQTLKIPYTESISKPIEQGQTSTASKEVFSVNNQEFIIHIVEQGQTVYSIARLYTITPKQILEANPDFVQNLPVGSKLLIPKTIENKETEQLPKQNTIVEAEKNNSKQEAYTGESTNEKPSQKIEESKEIASKTQQIPQQILQKKSIRIVFMLPFMLDINSKEHTETEIINKQIFIHPTTYPFIEYYEGVLLAVDSLRKKGVAVQLEVFDSSKDSSDIQHILSKINPINLDLIIGPVFPVAFSIAADFAKKHKIPIVSPLSNEDVAVKSNPYVIQVNSPQRYRYKEIAKFASQYNQSNVIFVYNSIDLEQSQIQECKRIFTQYYADSIKKYGIKLKEVYFPKLGLDGVEKAMSTSDKNIIIVFSRNQAFINNLVTKLFQFSKKYDIHLVGLPMWEKYDNLELDFLFALQFQFVSNGYVDYSNTEVKSFIELYRTIYSTEPSKYSFQGYDQMLYFSEVISNSAASSMQNITATNKTGLHDTYNFVREQSNSGVVNTSVQTIFYTKTFEKLYK